jgi:UDP-N-acetylmuramoyl-L-alanyl-D-glutamate--2,6-diaminopimelate ligase
MHKLHDLLSALPSPTAMPAANPTITGVTDDSRAVAPGSLFVAYAGVGVDAHRFIPAALARGASAVVCERADAAPADAGIPVVVAPNGRAAFAHLCAAWHGHPSRRMTVVGVTGTDGKTTTSTLLHAILTHAGLRTGLITTVAAVIGDTALDTGLHTTTPKADDIQRYLAQMRDAGATHCILEVTSHGLAQHRVDGIDFAVAVVTNITSDHLDLHGTREAYRAAKARLFEMAPVHVLNVDDEYSFSHLARLPSARRLLYSREVQPAGEFADWWLFAPRADFAAGTIDAYAFRPGAHEPLPLRTSLIGGFNVSNILAACAAARALGIPDDAVRAGIASVASVPGRMQRVDAGQPYLAVVDFAHTPASLDACLRTLREITPGRLIVAFGCAGARDAQKRPVMGAIAAAHADVVVLTSEDPREENFDDICDRIESGMGEGRGKAVRVPERGEALRRACALAGPGDAVVACGKGHERSLCFGRTEYAWDDVEAMQHAIAGRAMPLGPAIA